MFQLLELLNFFEYLQIFVEHRRVVIEQRYCSCFVVLIDHT